MQIILSDFMTLDGVVQAPGGPEEDTEGGFAHGGWSMKYFDPDVMGSVIDEVMERTEALLFGRRTWQVMAAAWPERAGDPFADRMNAIPKYVASRTLGTVTWTNSTLLTGDVPEAVRELKRGGGDSDDDVEIQVHGSPGLLQTLLAHDLVDEFLVFTFPVLIGSGTRLFGAARHPAGSG